MKLAKRFTGRTELVSMRRAYHGSTHGAMSMMGTPEGEEWKAAFRPLLPDVRAIEFNDFEALDRITRRTAAVLAEPVQGEAGVRTPAAGWLEACGGGATGGRPAGLRRDTTGLGRTGALRHAQIRHYTRYRMPGQGVRRRNAAGGVRRAARTMDACKPIRFTGTYHHLRRPPGLLCGGAGGVDLLDNKVVEQAEAKGALYETLLRDIRRARNPPQRAV